MVQITSTLKIDERELQFEYIRASGPGGQNVNKVATAVQLRFNISDSSLSDNIKSRLIKLAGKKITNDGVLVIEAKRFRTQEQNREDALHRFVELVYRSTKKPKSRIKTKPTKASREKRIKVKKQRGEIKKSRQNRSFD